MKTQVPDIHRKSLDEVAVFFDEQLERRCGVDIREGRAKVGAESPLGQGAGMRSQSVTVRRLNPASCTLNNS